MTPKHGFFPCFAASKRCTICDTSPTVQVFENGQLVIDSEACGPHFFNDRSMLDYEVWNEPKESMD